MTKETPSAAGFFDRILLWAGRLCRLPRTVYRRLEDGIIGPGVARARGLRHGRGLRLVGTPIVSCDPQAEIVLGDNVTINSRPGTNVLYFSRPCTLAARRPGARLTIGNSVSMSGATIVAYVSIDIGERSMLGSEAVIVDTDFHPTDPGRRAENPTAGAASKPVVIGRDVFIGMRAIILKGVTIGDGAVVGAGAVVAKDVGAGQIVAGNPARVVGSVFVQHKQETSVVKET